MEFNKHSEYHIFDSLIDNNIHFALFRLPYADNINLILQKSEDSYSFNQLDQLNSKKGFVIAPYNISGSCPILLISPDVVLNSKDAIFDYISSLNLQSKPKVTSLSRIVQHDSNSFNRYQKVYDAFQEELESGECSKLVLSRTFDIERGEHFSPGASFHKACVKYPNNFVYLCHTPVSGTWLGCSPEKLISGKDGKWQTDALAGTQKVKSADEPVIWDNKNKLEQQIVADYMQQQLQKAGIQATNKEAETIQAGDLLHLRSEFSFELDKPENLGDILQLLHPSPAVNGFPKDEAFRFILDNEGYPRSYYSGFLGLLDPGGQTDLYVNLRCMQVTGNTLRLYAGGGILTSSDLFSEWKETENKLQTILSIIENL